MNCVDESGNTLLHIAIQNGHLKLSEYLLDNGSDCTIQNKRNQAAIHQCVVSKQPEILAMLLNHRTHPDKHLKDKIGATALHYCAVTDDVECAKVLLKNKAKITERCNNGFFPIHLAAHNCSNEVLQLLITEGILFVPFKI